MDYSLLKRSVTISALKNFKLFGCIGILLGVILSSSIQAATYQSTQDFREIHALATASSDFIEVVMPEGQDGWRIHGTATANYDLYVRSGSANGPVLASSLDSNLHTIFIPPGSLIDGSTYFVEVHADQSLTYDVSGDPQYIRELTWDDGSQSNTISVSSTPAGLVGGDVLYKITAQDSIHGAMRFVLDEADNSSDYSLHIRRNAIPLTDPTVYQENYFNSERIGDDGVVLSDHQFSNNDEMFILIKQSEHSQIKSPNWTFFAGDIVVNDLGELSNVAGAEGTQTIGAEGVVFYQTSAPANTKAWQLWLDDSAGASTDLSLYVSKGSTPIKNTGNYFDKTGLGQMLLVPDYLTSGDYLVSVYGEPGSQVELVSKSQDIQTLSFEGSETLSIASGEFGYSTYEITVPFDQPAWQVTANSSVGDAQLYLRKGSVANETNNDGLSEAQTGVVDSITQVSPQLTNGTWYVTLVSSSAHTTQIVSGTPNVTDISFVNDPTPIINPVEFQDYSGWRYYRLNTDTIAEQQAAIGWVLELANHQSGTEIALRENDFPSSWQYRNGNTTILNGSEYDALSDTGLLQRPEHQSGIWYVGINSQDSSLGSFELSTRAIAGAELAFNDGQISIVDQSKTDWVFFEVVVPEDAEGWDLRLTNVSQGKPVLVVRRDEAPSQVVGSLSTDDQDLAAKDNWLSGESLTAGYIALDGRQYGPSGNIDPKDHEVHRILTLGKGSPLEAGTYYVGVIGIGGSDDLMSYSIESRGVGVSSCSGAACSLAIESLNFNGGTVSDSIATPKDLNFYRVEVPTNTKSFALELDAVVGEVGLAVNYGALPNSFAMHNGYDSTDTANHSGVLKRKAGGEFFYKYQAYNDEYLQAGTYYVAVISEGQNAIDTYSIGTGSVSYQLTSVGEMSVEDTTPTSLTQASPQLWESEALKYGEQKLYRFRVPEGEFKVDVQLKNRIGHPEMFIRSDAYDAGNIPRIPGNARPYKSEEGGWEYDFYDAELITLFEPGRDYTLLVAADPYGEQEIDTQYDLEIVLTETPELDFNGGQTQVSSQAPESWSFFKVTVPEDADGWDLRLANVTSGSPELMITRDNSAIEMPNSSYTSYGSQSTWDSGRTIPAPDASWDKRTDSADGTKHESQRIMTLGMGAPLEPGEYFVGVTGAIGTDAALSYTLVSRGIGEGTCAGQVCALPIVSLAFSGGVVNDSISQPREAAFYKVDIPAETRSWKLDLQAITGEVGLAINYGKLPNNYVRSGLHDTDTFNNYHSGALRRVTGSEHFYKYAGEGDDYISPGSYYIAVISEGQSPLDDNWIGTGEVSYSLISTGLMPVADETQNPVTTESPITWANQSLNYGEQKVYRFRAPEGTSYVEAKLLNRSGNPEMTMRAGLEGDEYIPAVGGNIYSDYVAEEGGWISDVQQSPLLLTASESGDYTIVVSAELHEGAEVGAGYDLEITAIGDVVLAFNNGSNSIDDQALNSWKYFKVTVPDDAEGWDVRLSNVMSGRPRLVIRRDQQPEYLSTSSTVERGGNWPVGSYLAAPSVGLDQRLYGVDGVSEDRNRSLTLGMGSPLEAGTYYIGVTSGYGDTEPMSYTVTSRGVGSTTCGGEACALPIVPLFFNGGLTQGSIATPRDTAFYKLEVPENSHSMQLHLEANVGDVALAINHSALPNSFAVGNTKNTDDSYYQQGVARDHPGDEYFYKYHNTNADFITAGTYYIGVISQGNNPVAEDAIGTGSVSFNLYSEGQVPIADASQNPVTDSNPVTWLGQTLEYGQQKVYRVVVPEGEYGAVIKLKNVTGSPGLSVRHDSQGVGHIPAIGDNYIYDVYAGEEGGWSQPVNEGSQEVVSLGTGIHTFVVAASQGSPANYDVEVTAVAYIDLNFDGGTAADNLTAGQRNFYRIEVPDSYQGEELAGWRVDSNIVSGSAHITFNQGSMPTIANWQTQTGELQYNLTNPMLAPGVWFIEVSAKTDINFTLASAPILATNEWQMPNSDNMVFGSTSAGGTDLTEGRIDYFRVELQEGNLGVLKTLLQSDNGNVELLVRKNYPPTNSHNNSVINGSTLTDRNQISEYGHWVPYLDEDEVELSLGTWWIGVVAKGGDTNYQLQLSTGTVSEMAQDGGSVSNQTISAGDIKYFKVDVPEASTNQSQSTPLEWMLDLNQVSGDVAVYIRDTVPPGQSTYASTSVDMDWSDDHSYNSENGFYDVIESDGIHTLSMPPVEPGKTYYLGVHAKTDAVYSLGSSVSAEKLKLDGDIDFIDGSLSVVIPAGEERLYRIWVPEGASRWLHTSTRGNDVFDQLKRDTVPTSSYNDWDGNYSSLSRILQYLNGDIPLYPWRAGHFYYLRIENTDASEQPYTLAMNGQMRVSEDFDADGMVDIWEYQYFGGTSIEADVDSDGDLLTNLEEFVSGTDPTSADSDGDGMSDGYEVAFGLNPNLDDSAEDPDEDGFTNQEEFDAGTDPFDINSNPLSKGANSNFNGDHTSDILWHNQTTGATQIWLMNAGAKGAVKWPGLLADLNWSIVDTGDFDGDGDSDLLWRNISHGGTQIWFMQDGLMASNSYPGKISYSTWRVQAVADVTGDGISDILWRDIINGGTQLWTSGVKASATYPGKIANLDWQIEGAGDYNSDGTADVLWRDQVTGGTQIWFIQNGAKASNSYPGKLADLNWQVRGIGDVNGDGSADTVWHNIATGGTQVWNGGLKVQGSYPGKLANLNWQLQQLGDYDGDGDSDLFWRDQTTGGTQLWFMQDGAKAGNSYPGALGDLQWWSR